MNKLLCWLLGHVWKFYAEQVCVEDIPPFINVCERYGLVEPGWDDLRNPTIGLER